MIKKSHFTYLIILLSGFQLYSLNLDSILKNPGDIYTSRTIFFSPIRNEIQEVSYSELDSIASFLLRRRNLAMEISSHNISIDTLYPICQTCEQAKSIANYLIDKGISRDRILHRGYNNFFPIVENAKNHEERQINNRIEFKVLQNDLQEKTTSDTVKKDDLLLHNESTTNEVQRFLSYPANPEKCIVSFKGCDDREKMTEFNNLFYKFFSQNRDTRFAFEEAKKIFNQKFRDSELEPILECH